MSERLTPNEFITGGTEQSDSEGSEEQKTGPEWDVRKVWRESTEDLSLDEEPRVPLPEKIRVYKSWEELEASELADDLAKCYAEVFRQPPWEEEYEVEEVLARLPEELAPPAALTLIESDSEEWPVVGFGWGRVHSGIDASKEIVAAARQAPAFREVTEEQWTEIADTIAARIPQEGVLALYEAGILEDFREEGAGLIQALFRPIYEVGNSQGVRGTIQWTTEAEGSRGYSFSRIAGYEKIAEAGPVVFFYLPDSRPVLKALRHLDSNALQTLAIKSARALRNAERQGD